MLLNILFLSYLVCVKLCHTNFAFVDDDSRS